MNDKISQEEIDNMLNQKNQGEPAKPEEPAKSKEPEKAEKTEDAANAAEPEKVADTAEPETPAKEEKAAPTLESLDKDDVDTVGEIGNIFMGSASTTLSQLLNSKVDITTPVVEVFENISESYVIEDEHLIVEVEYTEGLQGKVMFGLKKTDSAIIADLMMGGSGKVETTDIGELQLSAVGEAMNQMVGTASTTLSTMLNKHIEISPPVIKMIEKGSTPEFGQDILSSPIVAIKFNLKIGEFINSDIIQFMSVKSAKSQISEVQQMMQNMSQELKSELAQSQSDSFVDSLSPPPAAQSNPINQQPAPPPVQPQPQSQVTVQPVQFSSFDTTPTVYGETNRNLNLVMDVQLELTVELGRTDLPIKNVLELTRGSIIELDKVAGESVELYANGKLIAKGEVVVIEDNFGLRITSIISPEQRIQEI